MKHLICILFATGLWSCASKVELVELSTSKGDMLIYLYDETPKHKNNFLKLVDDSFYDGTSFHRVIKDFMIQGGDPYSKDSSKQHLSGQGGPGYTIEAEFVPKYYHKKGALAAARTGGAQNPEKKSSGSQFYIVQGKKIPEDKIDLIEDHLKRNWGDDFVFTEKMKQDYLQIGGTPHLDGAYTVFGEIITGFDVLDSIASVKTNRANRPNEDVKMTMKLVKKSKTFLEESGIQL